MSTARESPAVNDTLTETRPRDGYDKWSASYDAYDNPLIALETPVVRRLIGDAAGLDAADIGCGTGRYALWLVEQGARVTGVDFSIGMLDVLRGKGAPEALTLVEHDLSRGVPLADAAFDLVTCCLVLEHLADLEAMFRELARICRPGGRVVVSDFHPEMIRRGYHARFREEPGGEKFQITGAAHSVSDYVMAAVRAGLQIEHASEHIMRPELATESQSAKKWFGLPLLFAMAARKGPDPSST